jgi:hypothetical protein
MQEVEDRAIKPSNPVFSSRVVDISSPKSTYAFSERGVRTSWKGALRVYFSIYLSSPDSLSKDTFCPLPIEPVSEVVLRHKFRHMTEKCEF